MNKIFLNTIIIFFSALMFIGCNEDEVVIEEMEDVAISLAGDSATKTVELSGSETSDKWHIYSPAEDYWLTFEVIEGESAVIISVLDNKGKEERSSYIMIKSGSFTQRINVTQDVMRQLTLSKDQLRMRYVEYTQDVIVGTEGFKDITLEIDEADKVWLSASLSENTITVTTKENPLETSREAVILISAIESFTGAKRTKELTVTQGEGGLTPYVFELPDFSESKVYKVMDGDKQVAQITKEYLYENGVINSQAIVVYPLSKDGNVELHKGFVAQILLENKDVSDETKTFKVPTDPIHGGSVSFSIAMQGIKSYSQGDLAEPVTKIYMPGDIEMGPEKIEGSKLVPTEPYLIMDKRNEETNHYPIVKIGAQYWMGKHLNTVYYNSKKEFEAIPTNATDIEMMTAGSYSVYDYRDGTSTEPEAILNRERYGLLYSYLTIGGYETVAESNVTQADDIIDDKISPEGWIVPAKDNLDLLKGYIGGLGNHLRLRKFIDYDEGLVTGNQKFLAPERMTDENITGFDAPNSSYRSGITGFANFGAANGSWMYSRTFQGGTNATILHMNDVLTNSPIYRHLSIRSMNNGAISVTDKD